MKQLLKGLFSQLPPVKRLLRFKTTWEPGHYYSAIPDQQEGLKISKEQEGKALPVNAIPMNDSDQLALVSELFAYMKESTFRGLERHTGNRFVNGNQHYAYSDALYLEAMIRHLRPARIIEAGSGYTSALMLDVNDKYFDGSIAVTFIEPYPERLYSLLTEKDKQRVTIHVKGLQSTDKDTFRALQAGDILFIDSTHVAKTGSDLIYLFFEILPILNTGVYIHFHDIFNNFEYLPYHFEQDSGFSWNECYFLRAFLMYNPGFQIVLFTNYLDNRHKDALLAGMPDYPLLKGAQLWLKKA
jgi:hypothetical protein